MSSRLKSASSGRSAASRGTSVRTRGTSARTGKLVGSNRSAAAAGKDAVEAETYQCEPCKVEGSITTATNFCMDCGENLCEQCVNTHKKFPAMRNHQILGKSARRAENDTVVTVNPLECPDHPGRTVDMYCGQHNEVWCGACIAVNHRNCTSTRVIAEAAKGIIDSEEYKEIKIRMTAAKAEMVELKKLASTKLATLGKQKEKVTSKIKDFRRRINTMLDQMERDTELELEAEHGRCLQQLEHDLNVYNSTINNFDAFNSMLQVRKNDPVEKPSIVFVGIQRAKQKIQHVNEIVRLTKLTETDEYYQFYPDERIITWLASMKFLGVFAHQQRPYTSTSFKSYDVSHPTDKRSCDIYGSCLLDNGNVLLADWDNSSVKRLNENYKITDTCDVQGNPTSICCITPQEAAVTLTPQHTLQFIQLDKVMSLSRKVMIGESCRGVACNNGYIYVVCGGFKNETVGSVRIYTVAGALVKVVETNNSKQRIFSSPIAITVSSSGKYYHVTDGQRGIITVTQRNDVVSVISKRNVTWPCGICLDLHENILVCCNKSQTIEQKFGLNKLDTVLSYDSGVRRPSSICFDRKQLKLIITTNMANVLRVFQLEAGPITGVPPQTVPQQTTDKEQGKKKSRTNRVKAASVPLKKDTIQAQSTVKPEPSTKSTPVYKKDTKPLSSRSKTDVKLNEDKSVKFTKDTQRETTANVMKTQEELDEKTDYKKDPLENSNKSKNATQGKTSDKDKLNEAVGEIANDITKMLTSDSTEKSSADFKTTLQKIIDANALMKKSKTGDK